MKKTTNIRLERIGLIATIIFFSIVEAYFNGDSSYEISKNLIPSILYGIGTIIALWVAERYEKRLITPMIVFLLIFNFMANLKKFGVEVKDQTLEQVQTEFCKIHGWKKCQIQPTPSIGKEKIYPREVIWDEAKSYGWSWKQFTIYNKDVPRQQKEFNKEKSDYESLVAKVEKENKDFLALKPVKYSQFAKIAESFSSLSTVETMWLILRLVFGVFIAIMLVSLFENLQKAMIPLEVEARKVDSVEVEAIQKMALLKTDSHWRFRDPRNILKNFPMFPLEEGLKIIYEVRNATLPQKPLKTLKEDVKGIQGSSKGETPLATSNIVFFPKKVV